MLLLPLLGDAAGIIGLVVIIAGTVLAAPYADRVQAPIAAWWSLLAAGAIFALLGVALSYATDTVGGLLTALGGVLVVVGAAFALPARAD